MDRNEAMLRELNLHPQWVRRKPAPVAVRTMDESPAQSDVRTSVGAIHELPKQTEAQPPVGAIDETTSHLTNPAKDAGQVIGYHELPVQSSAMVMERAIDETTSHSTRLPKDDNQVAGYRESPLHDLGWPQIKVMVRDCTICRLRAGCTQTVFGVGDEHADWLFVGEGPGADEDALGEPFVGEAGRLLDNMLMAIKLKRGQNVYIANVIKCHPPANRPPAVDEIAACLPYLRRQIELIRPKLIVALGKVASNALLGKDAMLASLRGEVHDYHGIPMVVTYHPAYLLRSPSEKAKAWQDLCLAIRTIGS
jgi:DNA polymerase